MKKKLGRQLLVSLFVFTLFISVSNAEIEANVNYSLNNVSVSAASGSVERFFPDSGYTSESIAELFIDYRDNDDQAAFDDIVEFFAVNGYGHYFYYHDTSQNIHVVNFYKTSCDVGICFDASAEEKYMMLQAQEKSFFYAIQLFADNSLNCVRFGGMIADSLYFPDLQYEYYVEHGSVNSFKKMDYVTTDTWCWDGVTYVESQMEPDEPELPDITDEEVQNVVNLLLNSAYLDNRASDENSYFIVYDASDGFYYAYFYPDMYNLAYYYVDGNNEPTGTAEGMAYGFIQYTSSESFRDKVYNFISPWKYKEYTYHPDYMKTFVFAEEYSSSMNKFFKYFNPETTQIVYSSKNIPLLVTDPDDSNELIVDASGENDIVPNEIITSDVPVNEKPVTTGVISSFFERLRTFLVEQFNLIIAAIELVITKFFDLPAALIEEFGENIFTLSVAIIGKAFQVLISSISLLVRFASFLLTLVTIPADSTLFNVAVDGNVWGTNFIEGLNFLKNLSWNNLNLWTLFECFVASLEVIWTVKVIRRHYSSIM